MAHNAAQSDSQIHHHCPTCGHAAQTGPASNAATTAGPSAATTTTTTSDRCLSLATRIGDQVAELSIAINGYLALEHFVTPLHADENQASVAPPRIELTVLLRALNALVQQHMNALDVGVTVLRAQLSDGGEAQAR